MNLIQMLMALVVAYIEGSYPVPELSVLANKASRKQAIDLVPELKNAFAAYDAGEDLDWEALNVAVKQYAEEYSATPRAKSSYIKVLRIFATYYRNSSEASLKQIQKLSALVEDDYLQGYFTRSQVDQPAVVKKLVPIVKKLGGTGTGLTLEQSKEAREQNPEMYKEYRGLLSQYNEAWKAALDLYVRSTGHTTVPIGDVLKELKKQGIEHTMPKGFTGRVDAHATWYTMAGEAIEGGAPSAIMFPEVKMNPAYDPEGSPWVFQAIRADGTAGNYFYTSDFKRSQATKKYQRVAEFDADKARKKWLPLLRKFDASKPDPISVSACILEILFRTSNRIGTPNGNSSGGGFGICTLRVKHFYPQTDGGVKFIYLGKDNVKTTAWIKYADDLVTRQVCQIVTSLAEGKKPSEALFTYGLKNGSHKPVLPNIVNRVFSTCTGGLEGVTAHKLRTVKGTAIFREYIENLFATKTSLTAEQVKDHLMKAATKVGKQLNHVRRSVEGEVSIQPSTSLKNYVDPMLQVDLFMHYGVPIPAYLERLLGDKTLASVKAQAEENLRARVDALVNNAAAEESEEDAEESGTEGSEAMVGQIFEEGPEVLAASLDEEDDEGDLVEALADDPVPESTPKAPAASAPATAAPAPATEKPSSDDVWGQRIAAMMSTVQALIASQQQQPKATTAQKSPWDFKVDYDEKGRISNLTAVPVVADPKG